MKGFINHRFLSLTYGGGEGGGLPVVMMNIFLCTFFQGTDATVGDCFDPLGESHGKGTTHGHRDY